MKLHGIEFHGFKSFADSAEVNFHEGITAIVGPNGCGKSNISDALRWVLGEQRPTAIRGSRMEEAIFQGTERRKPIHRAEVTLQLDNEDRRLPVPYSEVSISRTVFRGGESEYRLNGTLCRLRDVQDLCRDTGLGTNAYAIIEGRMIDSILSDRAEERRAMFEEAAGISRYKERRRVASRRLDEADADLARVDDVIGEVESKIRSLAQQRGRARRYFELRERKLGLEITLAERELETLEQRRSRIESELGGLGETRSTESAQVRTLEAEHEAIRTRLADLDAERSENARALLSVRDRLAERERNRALAEERERNARTRLAQIREERQELDERRTALAREVQELERERDERRSRLTALRQDLQSLEVDLTEVAERRQAVEAAAASVEAEEQAHREEKARLRASVESARAEAAELARRLEEGRARLEDLQGGLARAEEARESAEREAREARERLERVSAELSEERERLGQLEAEHESVRGAATSASERLKAVEARIGALEPTVSGGEEFNPAVRAALGEAERLGVRDLLGRCLEVAPQWVDGVESYLGPLLEALLVDDSTAVERVRRWFFDEYDGQGGLIVLPLDRVAGSTSDLPAGIHAHGPGADWARHLLRDVRIDGESAARAGGAGARIGRSESVDALGVHRFGQPYAGGGLLARRAELERLSERKADLEREAAVAARRAAETGARLQERSEAVMDLERRRRELEGECGRLSARAEATEERLGQLREESVGLREKLDRLEEERRQALARASADERALADLRPVDDSAAPAPEEVASVREEWEARRDRVADLRLEEARAAAAVEHATSELETARSTLASLEARSSRLTVEGEELDRTCVEAREAAEKAAADLEELFEERERCERASGELEERTQGLQARASELEAELRRLGSRERELSERRHELELERSQVEADLKRARERVEDEWGRPFDELAEQAERVEGETEELATELHQVAERLTRLEPVNMLAEQEYQEESERLEFLQDQREDLAGARDDLRKTIRHINETASRTLLETLEQIRANFQKTFSTLFEGGECDVWLEDPEDPLDSWIEISASPSGKRTQRIHLLSGGERALTALALLFAIYLVKPSPFCVLDEVDAPLDETNIRRFVAMLEQFKSDVQFIVITHNPVTIEAADWIYGVTMEEPGVSKIVGVEFSDLERGAVA